MDKTTFEVNVYPQLETVYVKESDNSTGTYEKKNKTIWQHITTN